jgi:hypothetical protein
MPRLPTVRSVQQRMAEARRLGRQSFLNVHANGRGSDNWYVLLDKVYYDIKALWASAHKPPIATTSFQTNDAVKGFEALGFEVVSGVAIPRGLPGDAPASLKDSPPSLNRGDAGLSPLRPPIDVAPDKHFKPTGYWLFLANPKRWRADDWHASGQREFRYLVSKDDSGLVQVGDLGLLRVNKVRGEPARFLVAVEVVAAPAVIGEPDPRFFADPDEAAPVLRAALEVISAADALPVSAESLPDTPEFRYLHEGVPRTTIAIARPAFLAVAKALGADGKTLAELRASRTESGIRRLEANQKGSTPIQKERVSKYIERGPVGTLVKAARAGRCQVCEETGQAPIAFDKLNGEPYSEAHHVIPVSNLVRGSLGHQNIMVLCPNHHRQAHYGDFIVEEDGPEHWIIRISGKRLRLDKTRLPT